MKLRFRTIWVCTLALATELFGQTNYPQIAWLQGRVYPQSGLVDAFDDDQDSAPLYANALAAITFTHAGRFDLAAGIFNSLKTVYETSTNEGMHADPGGILYDQRPASQPMNGQGDFRTGENAWLVMALNYYESVSGDRRFAALATNLLEAICWYRDGNTNSISYGAFRWGGSNTNYSTEFQIDIYAALKSRGVLSENTKYLDFAADLRRYLLYDPGWPLDIGKTKVWLAYAQPVFGGELYDGSSPIYLDGQAWGVLALYPPEASEVNFACVLTNIDEGGAWQALRETVTCDGISVTGFSPEFLPGGYDQDWVWLEGTEFMSAAYSLIGNTNRSDYYHQQVAQLIKPDGSIYHSCANDGMFPTNNWPENYRVGSATTVCWYYFVETGINPFKPPAARAFRLAFEDVKVHPGERLSLTFSSVPGSTYRLWQTMDLVAPQWAETSYATSHDGPLISGPVTANSIRTTLFVQIAQDRGFFRVSQE